MQFLQENWTKTPSFYILSEKSFVVFKCFYKIHNSNNNQIIDVKN